MSRPKWWSNIRKSIVALAMIIVLPMITAERSEADFLSESRAVDAQIARGVVGPPPVDAGNRPVLGERIEALIPEAEHNCIPIADPRTGMADRSWSDAQYSLEKALRQIEESEIGAWLVQFAAAEDVTICLDHATTLEAHYRSHLRLLGLNARLGDAGRVVFLAHELAHVPQHPQFSNNRRFSPADMLLLQRVREAAAEAVATRVLWQLRQHGNRAPWQEKLTTAYHDIAEIFEATMAGGSGLSRELWATRSAFHHWFDAEWRLEIYDDLMLKTLTRIAEDPIGLIPTSRELSDHFLRGIGIYADQGFLIGGDGQALIRRFRSADLPAGGQARLQAILDDAGINQGATFSSLPGETVSAVSPQPTTIGGNR